MNYFLIIISEKEIEHRTFFFKLIADTWFEGDIEAMTFSMKTEFDKAGHRRRRNNKKAL